MEAPTRAVLFSRAASIRPGPNFAHFFEAEVAQPKGEKLTNAESFEEMSLPPAMKENLQEMGYEKPTPIQSYASPAIMSGTDVVAIAETGCGKTAAYLIPLIAKLSKQIADGEFDGCPERTVKALVILPARELAIQIFMEALKFSYGTGLSVRIVYGGASINNQRYQLNRGADILIATSGRLCDFIQRDIVDMRRLSYLVVDEADRVVYKAMMKLLEETLLEKRADLGDIQMLLFSATFPETMQAACRYYLHDDYKLIMVGNALRANRDVRQEFIPTRHSQEKDTSLLWLLSADLASYTKSPQGHFEQRTVVFANDIPRVDNILRMLKDHGIPAAVAIHRALPQRQGEDGAEGDGRGTREYNLEDFRTGVVPILIATDVVARGIDIACIQHVINYDLPNSLFGGVEMGLAEYVQRIGRTGRVGHSGRATAFYSALPERADRKEQGDVPLLPGLVKCLRDAQQDLPRWMLDALGTDLHEDHASTDNSAPEDPNW